jgi:hypothetical protein
VHLPLWAGFVQGWQGWSGGQAECVQLHPSHAPAHLAHMCVGRWFSITRPGRCPVCLPPGVARVAPGWQPCIECTHRLCVCAAGVQLCAPPALHVWGSPCLACCHVGGAVRAWEWSASGGALHPSQTCTACRLPVPWAMLLAVGQGQRLPPLQAHALLLRCSGLLPGLYTLHTTNTLDCRAGQTARSLCFMSLLKCVREWSCSGPSVCFTIVIWAPGPTRSRV